MKKRVISSFIIGFALLGVLYPGGIVLLIASLIVSLIGYFELMRATGVHREGRRACGLEMVGYIGILLHYALLFWVHDLRMFLVSILLVLFGSLMFYVLRFPYYTSMQVMKAVFGFLYIPVNLSFLCLMRDMPNGAYISWLPFCAWISDICALLVGMLCGKHKLAPKLSPKKTIEGSIGGMAGSAIAGACYAFILTRMGANAALGADMAVLEAIPAYTVMGIACSIISQMGDLAASGIKRDYGVKDYGKVIPGHGGIMDRFDSVIPTVPVLFLIAQLLWG